MLAVVDYGVGNLFSLLCSLKAVGADAVITADREVIKKSSAVILPGVGAFEDAAKKLENSGLKDTILNEARSGKPLLGICLGMQLLFDKSFEFGEHNGLGLIKGEIRSLAEILPPELKIPHMGWNALSFTNEKNPLFKYVKEGEYVYFVHSFFGSNCLDSVIANTEYGATVTAAVAQKNVYGCQFHPEKSGEVGLKILKAFCEIGGVL